MQSPPRYSPLIEASRGVAALAVVLFHSNLWIASPSILSIFDGNFASLVSNPQDLLLNILFGYGYLGVNLFFVVSGFCIHLPNTSQSSIRFGPFMARRLLRIYPLYFCVVCLLFVVYGPILGQYQDKGVNALNFAGHLFFWHYWGAPAAAGMGISLVFWTIAIEVQFYIFYACLFPMLKRLGWGRAALIFLTAEICYRVVWLMFLSQPDRNVPEYFAPNRFSPLRFGEWLTGAYLAEIYMKGRIAANGTRSIMLGTLTIFAGVVIGGIIGLDKYSATDVPACIGFFLILRGLLSIEVSNPGRKENKLFKWLGNHCYSIYLVHATVVLSASRLLNKILAKHYPFETAIKAGAFVMAVSAALLVAHLAYVFIESPSHNWSRRLGARYKAAAKLRTVES